MNSLVLGTVEKPWGWYKIIYQSHNFWVKQILVAPGEALSLQVHKNRAEYWTPLSPGLRAQINGVTLDLQVGVRYGVMKGQAHRVWNPDVYPALFIEVATGVPREDDIVRLDDKYGR